MSDTAIVLPQKLTEGDNRTLKIKYIDNGDGTFSQAVVVLTPGSEETGFDIKMRRDAADTNLIYVGKAPIGAATTAPVWQIKRLDKNTLLDVNWAEDNALFNKIWDDREGYTY